MVRQRATEKISNRAGNFLMVRFQGEVSGVEEVHFGVGVVALECLGARRQEERVILAPHGEQRRALCAEVLLKPGVEGDVTGVVQE